MDTTQEKEQEGRAHFSVTSSVMVAGEYGIQKTCQCTPGEWTKPHGNRGQAHFPITVATVVATALAPRRHIRTHQLRICGLRGREGGLEPTSHDSIRDGGHGVAPGRQVDQPERKKKIA